MTHGGMNADELRRIAAAEPLDTLMARAALVRDESFGALVTYSRKVFIPLTRLCRDVCSYCTFAKPPRKGERCYLTPEEVLAIARAGEAAGCREALFTLGDKPELRYRAARDELADLGYASTIEYLAAMCRLVLQETSLFPHANPGVMERGDIAALREVSISQGLMLESTALHLCERGGPHFGSPDKHPAARLETIRLAGEEQVPFTSGILIGIGETREERIDAMLALRALHEEYGHLQEIIVQNFRAKADTRMAFADEPDREELLWTIAIARLCFGAAMTIQAPPNLAGSGFGELIEAGINDWGGVSPVTPDHVNPEAPWPALARLAEETARHGGILAERLATHPSHLRDLARWQDEALHRPLREAIDTQGLPRIDGWRVGGTLPVPQLAMEPSEIRDGRVADALATIQRGEVPDEAAIVALLGARGPDFTAVCTMADRLRRETVGDTVRFVVNRNINYTNICFHRCAFCAFSKGKLAAELRGPAYDLDLAEVTRRTAEAWERGATEVCMQGGIHPHYTGQTYLELLAAAKAGAPDIHVHAFSPLEVRHGAESLGIGVPEFLAMLRDAGLGSLPGTAAEILADEVRETLCPEKLTAGEWLEVIEAAHGVGLRTTATIMYGHIEQAEHQAQHLLAIRALQERTGGFTEFVPLPFVAMEAPIYLKGQARPGPTFREAVLMHAVARLVLHPVITNIQVSWVKMGEEGVRAALAAGVNDLGGTLMNESISRAAGASHGQELPPEEMERVIKSSGRLPAQRNTLYGPVSQERSEAGRLAQPLAPMEQTAPKKRPRKDRKEGALLGHE
ncbi:7,8-didemethyl-8-hydroxy-5-deazariboflavin synthase [Croceicoccus estronivorus]|uniref:5-amino-6-(D-ribitylamino)uracil--L-tyrosine 4-hydroxyphenyl transferase CofH n=1 Tax=Croceicoccus estronivorus TaxID=1172626 RepID=UPI0008296077|nr:5-amino-6-(D-ribitylamino)uracil--L-tyrosine 4-hydroxyphenyl transferase CofH [Croceicoccus estronivorus]OCC25531.1 7,8-didemethyl-8-hydroxy-5-deazariboflavin synthase [Croceicoccus estronivorus]